MIRVNILTTFDSLNSHAFNFPLLENKERIVNRGYNLNFSSRLKKSFYEADILIFNSKFFISEYWDKNRKVEDLLEEIKEKDFRILWFDTTDSTGTGQFEVLPYVDKYYKFQILKDKKDYLKDFYGYRVYTDYYYREFGIGDRNREYKMVKPEEKYLGKIGLSWNSGYGDYSSFSRLMYRLRSFSEIFYFRTAKFYFEDKRDRKVSYRVNLAGYDEIVSFHRKKIADILSDSFNVYCEKIKMNKYIKELRNSMISVSSFGWGEICYRDFETFVNGSMLMKPDMSHLETWPEFFKDNETCISFKWNFNDLIDKIVYYLEKDRWRNIAVNAQKMYRDYLYSPEKKEEFCNRFVNILEGKI